MTSLSSCKSNNEINNDLCILFLRWLYLDSELKKIRRGLYNIGRNKQTMTYALKGKFCKIRTVRIIWQMKKCCIKSMNYKNRFHLYLHSVIELSISFDFIMSDTQLNFIVSLTRLKKLLRAWMKHAYPEKIKWLGGTPNSEHMVLFMDWNPILS